MYSELVERYWYSIDWDVEYLWQLKLPVKQIDVSKLEWHLNVPIWPSSSGEPYSVKPRDVLDRQKDFALEYQRVQDSDLKFPIEVFHNHDRLMILDGIHRLTKAISMNKMLMYCRIVPDDHVKRMRD